MSEKRVPYWEFMREAYKDLKYPPISIELDKVVRDMKERIEATDKVVAELREKIEKFETLLNSQGITRD